MGVSDADIAELASALHKASEPRPPTPSEPFDYPLIEAIARAKAGSVPDARMLLMLSVGMLKHREPAMPFNVAMLNGDLAAYLAEALDKTARGVDAKRALHLVRSKGRSAQTNEQRNAWIAYVAALFKHWGSRRHLAAAADFLGKANYPPPSSKNGWNSDAVRKALNAHAASGNK